MPISKYKEFEDEDIPLDEWLSTLSDSERGAIGAPDSITVDDVAGPGSPEPEPAEAHPSRSLESLMAGAVPSGPEPAALAALAEGRQPPPLEPPPMAAPTAAPLPKFDLSALGEAALTPGGAAQGPMAERGGLLGGSGVEALPPATTAAAVAQQAVQTPSPVPGDKPPLPAPGANAIAAQAPVESPPPEGADMVLPSISVPSRPQAAPPRPQQGQAPFRPTSPGDVMALREMDNARFDREQPQPSRGGGGFDWSLLGASIANAAAGRDMRPYIEARARNEQAHAARMDKREQQQRAARKRDAVEAAERQQMADAKDQRARLDDPGSPESKRLHAALAQSLGGDAAAYSHISAGDYKRYGLGGMIKGADARRFKAAEAQKAQKAQAAADEARYLRGREDKEADRKQSIEDRKLLAEFQGNTAAAKLAQATAKGGARAGEIERLGKRMDAKDLKKEVIGYRKSLEADGLGGGVVEALDGLEGAIAAGVAAHDGDVPGSGWTAFAVDLVPTEGGKALAEGQLSKEGRAVRDAQRLLIEAFGRGQSGAAIGEKEKESFAILTGQRPWSSDVQVKEAMTTFRAWIAKRTEAHEATYPAGAAQYRVNMQEIEGRKARGGGGAPEPKARVQVDPNNPDWEDM